MLKFFLMLESLLVDRVERTKDRGATAVEYGLMVGLISVVIIVAVTLIGTELDRLFDRVGAALKAVVTT
jgi:pilus assembly protein Flp/PilA